MPGTASTTATHYDHAVDLAALELLLAELMQRTGPLPLAPEPSDFPSALRAGLVGHFAGDYALITRAADTAARTATNNWERTVSVGLSGFSQAGDPHAAVTEVWSPALDLLAAAPHDAPWALARFLVMESALCSAQISLAGDVRRTGPDPHSAWSGHPIEVYMASCSVRVAAFAGDLNDAAALIETIDIAGRNHGMTALTTGVKALVTGNAANAETESLFALLLDRQPPTRDVLDRGAYLLAAFGAAGIGDKARAATLILLADTEPDLPHATIIDRAIGMELLIAAATEVEDIDTAQAWLDRLEQFDGHPIAAPPLHRARSRVALIRGDVTTAIAQAEHAIQTAVAAGRILELAESRVVLAAAQVASGDVRGASRLLRDEVAASDSSGFHAVRRAAKDVLRPTGRRLPPRRAGGWEVLSPRETEVANMVLSGLDHKQIAAQLFLSPATVRIHISRVLAAFGVSSRVALLAQLGPRGERTEPMPPLTPRQGEVAELVADGRSNIEIAAALGINVKAVEKHVGEAMQRWGVTNRFDLALHWLRQRC